MESNVSKNMKELFKSMEDFLTKKTVVGEPITVGNVIIIPLLDVSFGIGASSTQNKQEKEAIGGGMGGKITPNSILILRDGHPQVININNQENFGKILEMVPGIISKLNLEKVFKKKEGKE